MVRIFRFMFFFSMHCFLFFLQIDHQVKFVQQELELKKNEQRLAQLSSMRDQARIRVCARTDLGALKTYAQQELGLQPVLLSQFKKISVNA